MAFLTQLENIHLNLKNDIEKLESFCNKYEDKILPFREKLLKEEISIILNANFLIWAMFNLSEDKYVAILSKMLEREQEKWDVSELEPRGYRHSEESIAYIDRINFYFKVISENVDILTPNIILNEKNEMEISVTAIEDKYHQFFKTSKFYLKRVENIFNTMSLILSGEEINTKIEKWQELLTQNKFDSLTDDMLTYYKTVGDMNNYKLVIGIKQRLNKNQEDHNKGITKQDEYTLELNKITNSIIDLIFKVT